MEFRLLESTSAPELSRLVNALARQGWFMQHSYGIASPFGDMHCVWMWRNVPVSLPPVTVHDGRID